MLKVQGILRWFEAHPAERAQFLQMKEGKGKSPMTCRVLDWLVTKTSCDHNIIVHNTDTNEPIELHESYKNMLYQHGKKNADPFARGSDHRTYQFEDGTQFVSNERQLRFFYWVFASGTFKWAMEHLEYIREHRRRALESRGKGALRGVKKKASPKTGKRIHKRAHFIHESVRLKWGDPQKLVNQQ